MADMSLDNNDSGDEELLLPPLEAVSANFNSNTNNDAAGDKAANSMELDTVTTAAASGGTSSETANAVGSNNKLSTDAAAAANKNNDKNDSDDNDDDTLSIDSKESDMDFNKPYGEDPTEVIVRCTFLKEEGNDYFKEGDLSKACRSYRKATNLLKPLNTNNTGDNQVKALLVSLCNNHSMVCFRQERYKLSRDVATQALAVDNKNVKALYRRAVAQRKLGNTRQARDDLKQALQYENNNVAVRKELVSLKKEMEVATEKEKKQLQKAFSSKSGGSFLYDDKEQEELRKLEAKKQEQLKKEEELKQRKVQWEDECVKRMAKGEDAISFEDWEKEQKEAEKAKRKEEEEKRKEALKKARTPKSETVVVDSDEELTEKELAMLRGYKKTSDGRTTSYFNRELSEEEKKLLGTNAPKKLNTAPVAVQEPTSISPAASAEGKGKASAWNQAGTWEEKNTSDWCTGHLRSKLLSASVELPDGAHVAKVNKVDSLTGDASVAVVSGKKRYIFDYHASLQYEIRDESVDEVIASASFKLPDINSASHDELEVDVPAWTKAPTSEVEAVATQCQGLLVDAVRAAVQEFVNDFNAHY